MALNRNYFLQVFWKFLSEIYVILETKPKVVTSSSPRRVCAEDANGTLFDPC